MNNFIGNKSEIAIEYKIENKERRIGRARLWIHGDFLGSLCDTIFFEGYLAGGLYDIAKKDFLNFNVSDEDAFFKLFDALNDCDDVFHDDALNYCVNFGTWSDYFDIFSYKINACEGILMWRVRKECNYLSDLKKYPKKIFIKKVNYKKLSEMAKQLCNI